MSGSDKHFEFAINIAVEALKALFLFNAGSAGALIALTDKAGKAPHDYTYAILFFGVGALCTVIAFLLGYFSQVSYANHVLETEKMDAKTAHRKLNHHERFQLSAVMVVCVSLVFTGIGLAEAFVAAKS